MAKKLLSIGAALIMGMCLFCGCDNPDEGDNSDTIDYLKEYDDGSQLKSVTAETEGTLYSLEKAYEIGYLSQTDLKKISYFHNIDNQVIFPVELFSPVEAAIKSTYAEQWNADERHTSVAVAEDFTVAEFFGYYYKCCVISVDSAHWNYPGLVVDYWEDIGGVPFHWTDFRGLTVWIPNSYFYTLKDAYHYGWLSEEDLKSIAYYHNGGREGNEEIMGKDYTPKPKTPEVLDDETTAAIKQAFWDDNFSEHNPHNITLKDIGVRYFGCYGKYVAVKMWCGNISLGVTWEVEIGGVLFSYTDKNPIVENVITVWIQN